MDILVPNTWLKKYLDTKATPSEIAKYLSLCGPSIERIRETKDKDHVFSIEITTNRVDSTSILGIAREAQAILPTFGIKAKLKNYDTSNSNYKFTKKVKYLETSVDKDLCSRFTAVLIKNVEIKESPNEIKTLLEKVGVRPINNIVDVSNFVMHEIGQPIHTFDYDKIAGNKMILRQSKKGESITTLDDKSHILPGGDIVIEDGQGRLIDLCGIMGGKNSSIDNTTKNVLLFVQNYDHKKIRETSMRLAHRTEAAVLFEKQLDPELVTLGIFKSIELIEKLSGGKAEKEILDLYPKPYKNKIVTTNLTILEKLLGIKVSAKDITKYLEPLGFTISWKKDEFAVNVPSWRANDINIPEDIVEEVARIYGYHNLPSEIMKGSIPSQNIDSPFAFEMEIKQIMKSLGFTEVYNLSLVSKNMTSNNSLKIKNPLGTDSEYLRTTLKSSLINNVHDNRHNKGGIKLFEIANIYIPRKNDLPNEHMVLAGIITKENFRISKGYLETLLSEINIKYLGNVAEGNGYLPSQKVEIISNKQQIGEYGNLTENELFYFEFSVEKLRKAEKTDRKFTEVSKFPPQVEDLTLTVPDKTYIGNVIDSVKSSFPLVNKIELIDIFDNAYTFNLEYHDKNKTLTDKEVEEIRTKILNYLKSKYGISLKS